jgi:SAM-dependent methyltransferase
MIRAVRNAVLIGLVTVSALGCSSRSEGGERRDRDKPAATAPAAGGGGGAGGASAGTREVFTDIYGKAVWGTNAEGVGNSGTGSTLAATTVYRAFLQQFVRDHAIRSVVDAGCGDWEFSQAIDWTGIDYRGFDIVEAVVARNKQRHARPGIQFFVGNIVEDDLPAADLLLSKDVLQHLTNQQVQAFLTRQLARYKHVLLTNGTDAQTLTAANTDIAVGGYRPLDLTRPPFSVSGLKVLTYWDGNHMHQILHIARAN